MHSSILGVRASMVGANDEEEVDLWTGMREMRGSRAADGEPINETIDRVLDGNDNVGRKRTGRNRAPWTEVTTEEYGVGYEVTKLHNTGTPC